MAAAAVANFDAVKAASPTPFPARSKQAAGVVDGARTEITLTQFSDKVLLTITQEGRLAHWVHVPLEHPDPNIADAPSNPSLSDPNNDGSHLLPMPHLTATTILGAANGDRETVGQLVATQIASAISAKHPAEKRLLVVGLGLKKAEIERDAFLQLLSLALQCIS